MPILNEDFVVNYEAETVTEPADGNDGNDHNDDNIPEVKLRSHLPFSRRFGQRLLNITIRARLHQPSVIVSFISLTKISLPLALTFGVNGS